MIVNFGSTLKSTNYDKALDTIRQDPGLVRQLIGMGLDVRQQIALAKKLEITINDLTMIKKELRQTRTHSLSEGLDATVEQTGQKTHVKMYSEEMHIYGALLSRGGKFDGIAVRERAVATFMDMLNITKEGVAPAPIATVKDQALVKIEPIVDVAIGLSEKEITTKPEVREQLMFNFEHSASSKALSKVIIDTAPAMAPMEIAKFEVPDSKGKNRQVSLPVPSDVDEMKYDKNVATKVLYKANQLSYPRTTGIHHTAARHVHGIPFAPHHRKYVEFVTDVYIPQDVKQVHLYSSDVVYAITLHNAYPELKISIVGKHTMQETDVYLNYISKHKAKTERNKDKNIMGIWPVVEDKTQPNKKEKADQILARNRESSVLFRKYKYAFRPLNVHAMEPTGKYFLSLQVRNAIVIDGCGRGQEFDTDTMKIKVAQGVTHSYCFPFSWKTLYQTTEGYPTLLKHYSTINRDITSKTKLFDIMKGYMNKSEAEKFISVCSPLPTKEEETESEEEEEEDEDNGGTDRSGTSSEDESQEDDGGGSADHEEEEEERRDRDADRQLTKQASMNNQNNLNNNNSNASGSLKKSDRSINNSGSSTKSDSINNNKQLKKKKVKLKNNKSVDKKPGGSFMSFLDNADGDSD